MTAPAVFAHWQDRSFIGKPPVAMFNLTADIPGHPKGSTVAAETLVKAGYESHQIYKAGFPFFNLYRVVVIVRGNKLKNDVEKGYAGWTKKLSQKGSSFQITGPSSSMRYAKRISRQIGCITIFGMNKSRPFLALRS